MTASPEGLLAETLIRRRPRSFYDRDTRDIARELLGDWLVHVVDGVPRIGRIVETEAYLGPPDLAAHSTKGLTPRTRAMFGPPGHAYVYLIYGMHHCVNLVTQPEGLAAAVLIRALEPVANLEGSTRGPGLLCKAMAIDLRQYGVDLTGDTLFVATAATPPARRIVVAKRPRIGVDYAGVWARRLLRYTIKGNPFVSRP